MRRAPSNTISSNIDRDRTTVDSSTATFNIGVPSSPGLHPRSSSRLVKKEGTPRPRTHRRSTTSGHTSYDPGYVQSVVDQGTGRPAPTVSDQVLGYDVNGV